tara:strand:- start:7248 stop:7373 length:126 start_codon:yes stop_codon:yes gene_type:complete
LIVSLIVLEGEKLKIFANWSKKFIETFEVLFLDIMQQYKKN